MDQSGPARKQSLPLPMPRGRRLASASQDGCKDSAPDVERQSTRLPKGRAEIVLHPCGDCTPTCCACPEGTDLESLATALAHRPGIRSSPGQAASCGT